MSSNRKYIIWEPFLLSIMVVLGMLVGYKMKPGTKTTASTSEEFTNMEEVLRYIDSKYVDPIDRSTLQEAAIFGMLKELDPHTKYISPEDIQAIKEDMEGSYLGIGIRWFPGLDSFLYALDVSKDSPAQNAGIRNGDRLMKVDTFDFSNRKYPMAEIDDAIRSSENKELNIIIERPGGELVELNLERGAVPIPSIDCALMMNDSIGLIRINRFSSKTYKEFMQAWEELMSKGMTDMIIDVRDNPGGYLQETVKILSQFIRSKDELLVYTEGRNEKRKDYTSNGRIFHPIDDVIVLIDENSASASEILAGSFQDLDRALIVGRRSYGKGLVQEQYDLINGGAIRMTTARYYTPSGRLIQRDYDTTDHYGADLYRRERNGELTDGASTIADSTQHFTRAGRLVYGGGGVTPDVFVPRNDPFELMDESEVEFFVTQCALAWWWSGNQETSNLDSTWLEDAEVRLTWQSFLDSTASRQSMSKHLDEWAEMNHVLDHFQDELAAIWNEDGRSYFKSFYSHDVCTEKAMSLMRSNQVDSYLGNPQAILE